MHYKKPHSNGLKAVKMMDMSECNIESKSSSYKFIDTLWMFGHIRNFTDFAPSWQGFMYFQYKTETSFRSAVFPLPFINLDPGKLLLQDILKDLTGKNIDQHDLPETIYNILLNKMEHLSCNSKTSKLWIQYWKMIEIVKLYNNY